MKKLLIAGIVFCLTSCSLIERISEKTEDSTPGNRLFTKNFFTSATADTLMLVEDLYDHHGNRCLIERGDILRIRYFDLGNHSHEFSITAASTLDTLLGQLSGAAGVSFSLDPAGTGELVITNVGEPKHSMQVENLSNNVSYNIIAKALLWKGLITVGQHSEGALLKIADMTSSILTLRDSSGIRLNVEAGDTIHLVGETPSGQISKSWRLVMGEQGASVQAIADLIDSAIDKSAPSFGNTYAANEKGRLTFEMAEGNASEYNVKLYAENSDNDEFTPSRFNSVFIFKPLKEPQ